MDSIGNIRCWLNRNTIKSFLLSFISVILIAIIINIFRFDVEWIIGSRMSEITMRYGGFDFECLNYDATNPKYKSDVFYVFGDEIYEKTVYNAGFYKISKDNEKNKMIDGKEYCPVWVIEFDSNGYAESIKKGYYFQAVVKGEKT